jgi:hypothetical protein
VCGSGEEACIRMRWELTEVDRCVVWRAASVNVMTRPAFSTSVNPGSQLQLDCCSCSLSTGFKVALLQHVTGEWMARKTQDRDRAAS